MAGVSATAPLPWQAAKPLDLSVELGPGLEPARLQAGLERLCREPGIRALVAFGSRGRGEARADSDLDLAVICAEASLTPEQKRVCWRRCRDALGLLGQNVDLVVVGAADAAHLAGSRWHVMGDVAREGKVLYAAG
ncbi:nucleotidyltransferase domain-containing protein [Synechococcus sp. CBW1107]|uniref:nucleotidyltransferase family protein n=1 Tax=Synechococcus sp. CBW1107 TaxID=2789857 RepID=UPI0018CD8CE6|nr:nucleotidyltransferase domain-containing protein [Synechococcus sp. CBW1107]QPN57443.1 nucleotidyltransferase domain-containing protein [Synechococcus sp. CBW1107]